MSTIDTLMIELDRLRKAERAWQYVSDQARFHGSTPVADVVKEAWKAFRPGRRPPLLSPDLGCQCKGHPFNCFRHPVDCGCTEGKSENQEKP